MVGCVVLLRATRTGVVDGESTPEVIRRQFNGIVGPPLAETLPLTLTILFERQLGLKRRGKRRIESAVVTKCASTMSPWDKKGPSSNLYRSYIHLAGQ